MFAPTIRCPVCGGRSLARSRSGWVRHLTRLLFVFPLRCRNCLTRFWRLTLAPPPYRDVGGKSRPPKAPGAP